MNKRLSNGNYDTLLATYIKEKKNAYQFYETFKDMTDNDKVEQIRGINECDYGDKIINEAITCTLLYPNDYNIVTVLNSDESIKSRCHLDADMSLSKQFEYKTFNLNKLIENGVLTIEEMSQGSTYGDNIYQKYTKNYEPKEEINKNM